MEYAYIKFINLQYWYCVIYSLFGGTCAEIEALKAPDVSLSSSGTIDGSLQLATTSYDVGTQGVSILSPIGGVFQQFIDILALAATVIGGAIALLWALYSALAYTISGILMMVIFSSLSGLLIIRYRELELYGTIVPPKTIKHPLKSRWQGLLEGAMSVDPKRWRESIIEADDMLGELLQKLGYAGNTTADRMRKISEGAFVTLPAAWEAHRIRNFVVARSSDYILTQREAFRVMKLFEQVFEEFDFI